MTSDLDIYRSAAVLIRQFGSRAPGEAAARAQAMAEKGNPEGQLVWQRIERAVQKLQRTERPSEEPLQ